MQFKTAYYSFILPVRLAFILANVQDEAAMDFANEVLLEIGEFFQIQDDFLDFYGDPQVTGKIGTDIQDNKCSWLIVNALKLASPEQRTKLQENYGTSQGISAVTQIFHELKLDKLYEHYSATTEEKILDKILTHCPEQYREIYLSVCKFIFKRIY